MSFSSDVKAELCKVPISKRCCACAEAYGVLLYANTFSSSEVRIMTGSPDFSRRLPRLFRRAFGVSFDSVPADLNASKQIYLINDRSKISVIFGIFGYEADKSLAHHINFGVLEDDCCRAAFIRGAFLSGGSITDPSKRYHLELVTDHYNVSRETLSILLEMGFSPKDTSRGGNYITYFKQSESIEDFFTTIGAPVSALEIMSAKVEKDMRNSINRKVNCDSANADKVVNAAQEQLDAIRRIDRSLGVENLPDKLQETAFLRIANPEASISDLAMLADPPVSKLA
jgi:DNA-binding protein WhiA